MIKIRYASLEDYNILGEIHASSWQKAYRNIIPDDILLNITAEKRALYFKKALGEKLEKDALIFYNDDPAGFITIGKCRDKDKGENFGEIWGLYLSPHYFNKGLGAELLIWGIKELKASGYEKITLWVLEDNLKAIRFYKKQGFVFDGTIKELDIGKKLNECRYTLSI